LVFDLPVISPLTNWLLTNGLLRQTEKAL